MTKIYSVNEQTLIDLHQYLLDEYEEDNTNAEAIRLLKLLDKILGWKGYTYYNPDVDEDQMYTFSLYCVWIVLGIIFLRLCFCIYDEHKVTKKLYEICIE